MIAIKPHHFVDILISFHEECIVPEQHHYGHDVHTVTRKVINNPDTLLRMELGADDICTPCVTIRMASAKMLLILHSDL
jgi:hypothetical protein